MSDSKITQLAAVSSMNAGDIIPVVIDPSGSPANKKIAFSDFATAVLGGVTPTTIQAGDVGTPRSGTIELKAGTNITVTDSPAGTFTIASVACVTSIKAGDSGTLRTGAVELKAGTAITITDVAGVMTIAAVIPTTVTSIQAGAGTAETGVVILVAGTGITITDSPAGTFTIAASASLAIGTAVGSSTIGSVLYIDGSNNLAQDNTALFWDATNHRLFIGPHATPPTNASKLTINDSTNAAAFVLCGKAQNNSTDTEGMRFVLFNNSSANRQVFLTDSSYPVSNDTSTHTAIRLVIASGIAAIDALSTDGSTPNVFYLGNGGSQTIVSGSSVAVNSDSSGPNANAQLDIKSTTKGLLPPRMTTTQKNAISGPPEGLEVYDSTLHKKCVFTGSTWETVTSS